MRILVTGAAGMLGTEMVAELEARGHEVCAAGRSLPAGRWPRESGSGALASGGQRGWLPPRVLDVTDLAAVRRVVEEVAPDAVVNCAAYTNVDGAEAEPELALRVNGLGPRNLALACQTAGAVLVHVSTDYVFNGEKAGAYGIWDSPDPVNAYGASKLCGENYVRSLMHRFYIVRTSWLFGRWGRSFVSSILELANRGEGLRVVADQRGCPTYTGDLARACADLLESGCFGLYHATCEGATTWYEFAEEVLRCAGLRVDLTPVTAAELSRPARRPRNSVLDPFPLKETIGYGLPHWGAGLAEVVRALLTAASTSCSPAPRRRMDVITS